MHLSARLNEIVGEILEVLPPPKDGPKNIDQAKIEVARIRITSNLRNIADELVSVHEGGEVLTSDIMSESLKRIAAEMAAMPVEEIKAQKEYVEPVRW